MKQEKKNSCSEKLTIYLVVENWNSKKTSKKMSKAAKRLGLGANDINRWGGEKNGNFSSPVKVFVVQCSANAVSDFGLLNGKRLVRERVEYAISNFPSNFYVNFSWLQIKFCSIRKLYFYDDHLGEILTLKSNFVLKNEKYGG